MASGSRAELEAEAKFLAKVAPNNLPPASRSARIYPLPAMSPDVRCIDVKESYPHDGNSVMTATGYSLPRNVMGFSQIPLTYVI